MTYTVITATGRVLVFTIRECAEIYKQAYGGVMFTNASAVCRKNTTILA